MPVTLDEFVGLVEEIAPRSLAYEWDNTGLLLRCGETVSRVLIALDATREVAEEAAEAGCDMILTHHPLVFSPVKSLSEREASQSVLMFLIRNGISLYAAHTSFDRVTGGINDSLAELLGLTDVQTVGEDNLMRVGNLALPLSGERLIVYVKQSLNIPYVRVSRGPCKEIKRVAVVGGSGGEFVALAKQEGAQALLTGEAKHHHLIEAGATNMLLIEAGHFDTERCFVDVIFKRLQLRTNALQLSLGLKKANSVQAPYEYR